MNWLAAYGLLAHGLIFGALAALLPFGDYRGRAALVATTIALMVGIAPAMHGIFGAPSVTLVQLAILAIAGHSPSPLGKRAAFGLLGFAAFYYPSSLGWGIFDPYTLGYQPWPLLAALGPVGIALWRRRLSHWLLILAVDLAAYASGVFANLWDVLLDPLLVLLAIAIAGREAYRRFIAARRR